MPRNNGENFTLNIQNSPLKEKFYNLSFQQRSQVHVQIKTFFSLNSQDRTRLIVVRDKPMFSVMDRERLRVTNFTSHYYLDSLKCL